MRGDRAQLAHWGHFLAGHGIAAFSIDYQRADRAPAWPTNRDDVLLALDYLRDHASRLGIDAGRIGLLGASAGAHLAASAAFTAAGEAIKVLILAYGPYDLVAHQRLQEKAGFGAWGDTTSRMLGCTPGSDPERFVDASPLNRIVPNRVKDMAFFLIWGDQDEVVCPEQSVRFARALKRVGATVWSRSLADAGHFWFSRDALEDAQGHTQRIAPLLLRFLTRYLWPRDPRDGASAAGTTGPPGGGPPAVSSG